MLKRRHARLWSTLSSLVSSYSAFAGSQLVSVDQQVQASTAVVVVNVKGIDAHHGEETTIPMTAYRLELVELLRGTLPKTTSIGEEFELVVRGGYLFDGSYQSWSEVPELKLAATYVLMLRDEYYVSPFLPTPDAVVLLDGGVDGTTALSGNRPLRVSHSFGLLHLKSMDSAGVTPASEVLQYLRLRAARAEGLPTTGPVSLTPKGFPGEGSEVGAYYQEHLEDTGFSLEEDNQEALECEHDEDDDEE